jgi:hypothetical protein
MKVKLILFIAFVILHSSNALLGQTWNLIIPPSAYDTINLNFSNTAFNQNSSIFYSVYKSGSDIKIQSFNLNSNTTSVITTSNLPPMDLNTFTQVFNVKTLKNGKVEI